MPRLSTLISLDAQAALSAAQAPSASNPFVTTSQLSGGGSSQDGLQWFGGDVEDGDEIEAGFVYNIPAPGPETTLTLHIAPDADAVNKRLAFKVVAGHEGRIVVVAYEGDAAQGKSAQFIENDAGEFGYEAAIDLRSPGEYREWQMEFGTWMLVSKLASQGDQAGAGMVFPFTMRAVNTAETGLDELGVLQFDASKWPNLTVMLGCHLEVSAPGQTATLELFNVQDSEVVTTLTSTSPMTEPLSTFVALPWGDKLYSVRLKRTGGTAQQRVTCRSAWLELTQGGG